MPFADLLKVFYLLLELLCDQENESGFAPALSFARLSIE